MEKFVTIRIGYTDMYLPVSKLGDLEEVLKACWVTESDYTNKTNDKPTPYIKPNALHVPDIKLADSQMMAAKYMHYVTFIEGKDK